MVHRRLAAGAVLLAPDLVAFGRERCFDLLRSVLVAGRGRRCRESW
jgi:hypothetical protein